MDREYEKLKNWLEETRDQPLEAMDAFFDARVEEYEDHMSPWRRHYAWMADLLPEGAGTLLDVGCGTGLELDRIFRRFPDLEVTGVDLSREMLAKLREKHGDKNLTLLQGDYFALELGRERYDAAVAFETLHHFPAEKKRELFAKIRRSLRPGGVYLECDYIAGTQEIEDLVFSEYERRRRRDGVPEGRFVHFDTPLTLAHEMEALEAAGFSAVELAGYLPGDANTAVIRAVRGGG